MTASSAGTAQRPIATAGSMFVRELLRRWPTVLFMIFLPVSYFLVSYLTNAADATAPARIRTGEGYRTLLVSDRDLKAIYLAVLGISVTSSFAALSTTRGNAAVMRRLRLVGYRAHQLLSARLLVLMMITVVATAVFMAVMMPLVEVRSALLVSAALLLVGLIGVALGTLIGLLVEREFEATMIVIAVAGIQMALGRGGSTAERYLPYWPAVESLKTAAFSSGGAVGGPLALGGAYVVVLLGLSFVVWRLRTRIWRG